MATWIKIGAAVFAAVAIFFGGYRYAAALYQSDIDEMKAAHAMALAQKENEYRANQSKQISAYAEAIDQLEKKSAELAESRADSGSLRLELERVRQLAERERLVAIVTRDASAFSSSFVPVFAPHALLGLLRGSV